jgi:hypothetical protein
VSTCKGSGCCFQAACCLDPLLPGVHREDLRCLRRWTRASLEARTVAQRGVAEQGNLSEQRGSAPACYEDEGPSAVMARGKRSGTTREQQSSGLFPWRAGEEEQEGLHPWRKESPAALLGLPIGEENRRVSHGRVEEAAVTADQSPSSAAAHPCPPLEARPPLPSAGRIGSVCTTPFLGRVGGAPENGC